MKFRISIARNTSNKINLMVEDDLSGIEFLHVEMTPEAFGKMVTGLAGQHAEGEVRHLEYVGKKEISELRTVECPIQSYNKEDIKQWLIDNCQEEGWTLNTYLGSKNSICCEQNKTFINYSVTKYI